MINKSITNNTDPHPSFCTHNMYFRMEASKNKTEELIYCNVQTLNTQQIGIKILSRHK